jgi:hypothetical protein
VLWLGLLCLTGSVPFYGTLYADGLIVQGQTMQALLSTGVTAAYAAGMLILTWALAKVPPHVAAAACGVSSALCAAGAAAFPGRTELLVLLCVAAATTLVPTFALNWVGRAVGGGAAVGQTNAVWFLLLAGEPAGLTALYRAIHGTDTLWAMAAVEAMTALGAWFTLRPTRGQAGSAGTVAPPQRIRVSWGAQVRMLRQPPLGQIALLMACEGVIVALMQSDGILQALQLGLNPAWLAVTLLPGVLATWLGQRWGEESPRAAFGWLLAALAAAGGLGVADTFVPRGAAAEAILFVAYGVVQVAASALWTVALVAGRHVGNGGRHAAEGALRQAAPLVGQVLALATLPLGFAFHFRGTSAVAAGMGILAVCVAVSGRTLGGASAPAAPTTGPPVPAAATTRSPVPAAVATGSPVPLPVSWRGLALPADLDDLADLVVRCVHGAGGRLQADTAIHVFLRRGGAVVAIRISADPGPVGAMQTAVVALADGVETRLLLERLAAPPTAPDVSYPLTYTSAPAYRVSMVSSAGSA